MDFNGFSVVDFAPINQEVPGFVYILFLVDGSKEVPFYVGQTKRIWGRLDDYYWAMFSARTDFHVGEAVKHLNALGYRVRIKYKSTCDPLVDEGRMISQLQSESGSLMNNWKGFDFKTTNEAEGRDRVHEFLDKLLSDLKRQG